MNGNTKVKLLVSKIKKKCKSGTIQSRQRTSSEIFHENCFLTLCMALYTLTFNLSEQLGSRYFQPNFTTLEMRKSSHCKIT